LIFVTEAPRRQIGLFVFCLSFEIEYFRGKPTKLLRSPARPEPGQPWMITARLRRILPPPGGWETPCRRFRRGRERSFAGRPQPTVRPVSKSRHPAWSSPATISAQASCFSSHSDGTIIPLRPTPPRPAEKAAGRSGPSSHGRFPGRRGGIVGKEVPYRTGTQPPPTGAFPAAPAATAGPLAGHPWTAGRVQSEGPSSPPPRSATR
jgi:hypothetical protein